MNFAPRGPLAPGEGKWSVLYFKNAILMQADPRECHSITMHAYCKSLLSNPIFVMHQPLQVWHTYGSCTIALHYKKRDGTTLTFTHQACEYTMNVDQRSLKSSHHKRGLHLPCKDPWTKFLPDLAKYKNALRIHQKHQTWRKILPAQLKKKKTGFKTSTTPAKIASDGGDDLITSIHTSNRRKQAQRTIHRFLRKPIGLYLSYVHPSLHLPMVLVGHAPQGWQQQQQRQHNRMPVSVVRG